MVSFQYLNTIIQIRNPELGNTDRYDPRMILNSSRSGKQIISRPSNRPTQRTFSWSFTTLTESKKDELIAFLNLSAANPVTLVSYDGNVYEILITTNAPNFTTARDLCSYSVDLDFIILSEVEPSPS